MLINHLRSAGGGASPAPAGPSPAPLGLGRAPPGSLGADCGDRDRRLGYRPSWPCDVAPWIGPSSLPAGRRHRGGHSSSLRSDLPSFLRTGLPGFPRTGLPSLLRTDPGRVSGREPPAVGSHSLETGCRRRTAPVPRTKRWQGRLPCHSTRQACDRSCVSSSKNDGFVRLIGDRFGPKVPRAPGRVARGPPSPGSVLPGCPPG